MSSRKLLLRSRALLIEAMIVLMFRINSPCPVSYELFESDLGFVLASEAADEYLERSEMSEASATG